MPALAGDVAVYSIFSTHILQQRACLMITHKASYLLVILQEAGIPVKLAPTIGIAVDHRRRNRSLESLQVSDVLAYPL